MNIKVAAFTVSEKSINIRFTSMCSFIQILLPMTKTLVMTRLFLEIFRQSLIMVRALKIVCCLWRSLKNVTKNMNHEICFG